jgi:CcmD family protein
MENGGYLFAAFAIVWAVTFAYVFLLYSRQAKLQREIQLLREELKKKDVAQ